MAKYSKKKNQLRNENNIGNISKMSKINRKFKVKKEKKEKKEKIGKSKNIQSGGSIEEFNLFGDSNEQIQKKLIQNQLKEKTKPKYREENKTVSNSVDKYIPDDKVNIEPDSLSNKLIGFTLKTRNFRKLRIPGLTSLFETFMKAQTSNIIINYAAKINFISKNKYLEDIIKQIANESTNKVKIYKYKLYLYNINNIIDVFIHTSLKSQNHDITDLDIKFERFIKKILGIIPSSASNTIVSVDDKYFQIYKAFNVKVGEQVKNLKSYYMDMYIPKLESAKQTIEDIKKKKAQFKQFTTNAITLGNQTDTEDKKETVGGGGISSITNIKNIKNITANEARLMRTNFDNGWKTLAYMKNNDDKMYTYNKTGAFKNLPEISLGDKRVSKYFEKCNDLQIFYINKHIELYELFNKMHSLIKSNVQLNDIISKLLDPELIKSNTGLTAKVKLNPMVKQLTDILTASTTMSGVNKELYNLRGGAEIEVPVVELVAPGVPREGLGTQPVAPEVVPEVVETATGEVPVLVPGGVPTGETVVAPGATVVVPGTPVPVPVVVPVVETEVAPRIEIIEDTETNMFDGKKTLSSFVDTAINGDANMYFDTTNNNKTPIDFKTFTKLLLQQNKTLDIVFGSKLINFNDYLTDIKSAGNLEGTFKLNNNTANPPINISVKVSVELDYNSNSIKIKILDDNSNNSGIIENITENNVSITIPDLKKHYVKMIPLATEFQNIKPGQIVYGKIKQEEANPAANPDSNIEIMMTYSKKDNDDKNGIFRNILLQSNNERETLNNNKVSKLRDFETKWNKSIDIWEADKKLALESKKTYGDKPSFQYVGYYIDSFQSYSTLQAIKRVQLANLESLHVILGDKTNIPNSIKLEQKITEYKANIKQGVVDKYNTNSPMKEIDAAADTKWSSFTNDNSKNKHFDLTNEKFSKYKTSTSNSAVAQQIIYKCYDLQILYLIKHLEVVEMFKILFYYFDMLNKQMAIFMFVMALYKKEIHDSNDEAIEVEFYKILENVNNLVQDSNKINGNVMGNPVHMSGGAGDDPVVTGKPGGPGGAGGLGGAGDDPVEAGGPGGAGNPGGDGGADVYFDISAGPQESQYMTIVPSNITNLKTKLEELINKTNTLKPEPLKEGATKENKTEHDKKEKEYIDSIIAPMKELKDIKEILNDIENNTETEKTEELEKQITGFKNKIQEYETKLADANRNASIKYTNNAKEGTLQFVDINDKLTYLTTEMAKVNDLQQSEYKDKKMKSLKLEYEMLRASEYKSYIGTDSMMQTLGNLSERDLKLGASIAADYASVSSNDFKNSKDNRELIYKKSSPIYKKIKEIETLKSSLKQLYAIGDKLAQERVVIYDGDSNEIKKAKQDKQIKLNEEKKKNIEKEKDILGNITGKQRSFLDEVGKSTLPNGKNNLLEITDKLLETYFNKSPIEIQNLKKKMELYDIVQNVYRGNENIDEKIAKLKKDLENPDTLTDEKIQEYKSLVNKRNTLLENLINKLNLKNQKRMFRTKEELAQLTKEDIEELPNEVKQYVNTQKETEAVKKQQRNELLQNIKNRQQPVNVKP